MCCLFWTSFPWIDSATCNKLRQQLQPSVVGPRGEPVVGGVAGGVGGGGGIGVVGIVYDQQLCDDGHNQYARYVWVPNGV